MIKKICFLSILFTNLILFVCPVTVSAQESTYPKKEATKKPSHKKTILTQEFGFNLLTGISFSQKDGSFSPLVKKLRLNNGIILSYNLFIYENLSLKTEFGVMPVNGYNWPHLNHTLSMRYYLPWFFIGLGFSYHYELKNSNLKDFYGYLIDIGYVFPLSYGNIEASIRFASNATKFIDFPTKLYYTMLSIVVGYNIVI